MFSILQIVPPIAKIADRYRLNISLTFTSDQGLMGLGLRAFAIRNVKNPGLVTITDALSQYNNLLLLVATDRTVPTPLNWISVACIFSCYFRYHLGLWNLYQSTFIITIDNISTYIFVVLSTVVIIVIVIIILSLFDLNFHNLANHIGLFHLIPLWNHLLITNISRCIQAISKNTAVIVRH